LKSGGEKSEPTSITPEKGWQMGSGKGGKRGKREKGGGGGGFLGQGTIAVQLIKNSQKKTTGGLCF